jgi:predicted dehydrogenase
MGATKLGVIGYGIMGERLLRAATGHGSDAVTVAGVWDLLPRRHGAPWGGPAGRTTPRRRSSGLTG